MNKTIIDLHEYKKTKEKMEKEAQKKFDEEMEIIKNSGHKEMEQYKVLVGEFLNKTKELAIFEKYMDEVMLEQLNMFLIDEILDNVIKPVFEGDRPDFIPEDVFQMSRVEMYESLRSRYIDKN